MKQNEAMLIDYLQAQAANNWLLEPNKLRWGNVFDGNTHSINEENSYAIQSLNNETDLSGLTVNNSIITSDNADINGIKVESREQQGGPGEGKPINIKNQPTTLRIIL